MKKIFTIVSIAAVALGMIACKPSQEKTIANLKAAIDGEAAASAKYAAFAEQATSEGYPEVAALFQATSAAEAIHINNHQNVLVALGVTDYVPATPEFQVDSTMANLKVAIEGEKYESETMYPEFIAAATAEKANEAVVSFTYAMDAEKSHAAIYEMALQNLMTPGAVAAAYFVCPKCGNVYAGEAAEICEFCQTPMDQFIAYHAVMPLVEEMSAEGAEGAEAAAPQA